jgi:flagellar hook protein FlgE
MIDFSAPLSGMAQATTTVNQIARRLSNPTSDTVDLSTEMVSLIQARNDFSTNVKVAQTEDQMAKSLLSIFA